jgi:hypothetical protein
MEKVDARALLGITAGASETEIEAAYRQSVSGVRKRFETARGRDARARCKREFAALEEARDSLLSELENAEDEPRNQTDVKVSERPPIAQDDPILLNPTAAEITNLEGPKADQITAITGRRAEPELVGESPAENGQKPEDSAQNTIEPVKRSENERGQSAIPPTPPEDVVLTPVKPSPSQPPLWRNPWLMGSGAIFILGVLAVIVVFHWPHEAFQSRPPTPSGKLTSGPAIASASQQTHFLTDQVTPETATASASQPLPSLTDRIRQFVEDHLHRKEAGDIKGLLADYAKQVDYFEDKNVDQDFIRKDLANYFQRWPIIKYKITRQIEIGNTQTTKVQVRFYYDYETRNSVTGNSGLGWASDTWLISVNDGSLLIVSEQEEVHRYNPAEKPKWW